MIRILAIPLRRKAVTKDAVFLFAYTTDKGVIKPPISSPLATKVLQMATKQWDTLGALPDSYLRKKLYNFGMSITNKFHRDEWMLKDLAEYHGSVVADSTNAEQVSTYDASFQINYSSLTPPDLISKQLSSIYSERYQRHPLLFRLSAWCVPLSIAAGIIPGPNVFLAYNVFRLYSHFKASKGLEVLNCLIRGEPLLVVFNEDLDLDRLLNVIPNSVSAVNEPVNGNQVATIDDMITEKEIEAIQQRYQLPQQHFYREINRALAQVAAELHSKNKS